MTAFLTAPYLIPYRPLGRQKLSVCRHQRFSHRPQTRVLLSALNDEIQSVNNTKSEQLLKPPSRPAPVEAARPSRPTSFQKDPATSPTPSSPETTTGTPSDPSAPDSNQPVNPYFTSCAKCNACYEMHPDIIGEGRKLACCVCGNEWFQNSDRLSRLKASEEMRDYPMDRKEELIGRNEKARNARRGDARDRRAGTSRTFSVFIGNLPYTATQEELFNIVSATLIPQRISILKDAEGKSRGFAFANVKSEDEVNQLVVALNGVQFGGRMLLAKPGRRN